MYEFAIVALGGLLVAKTVEFLGRLAPNEVHTSVKLFAAALAGVAYAYLFDYSLFGAWDIGVRSAWIGTVATGLFMAVVASVWHEALELMRGRAHRYRGEASEIDARMQRAA